jgi:hypothetical protein
MSAADAALDPDGDGLTNYQESLCGSNPAVADTDGDGLSDGFEVTYNFNGLDGLPGDYDPYSAGGGDLNPTNADTRRRWVCGRRRVRQSGHPRPAESQSAGRAQGGELHA